MDASPNIYRTALSRARGLGSAKERAAVGMNPVPGVDVDLEDVAGLPQSAVTATVEALSALIETGRPEFRDKTWVPHRPSRPDQYPAAGPRHAQRPRVHRSRPGSGPESRRGRRHISR